MLTLQRMEFLLHIREPLLVDCQCTQDLEQTKSIINYKDNATQAKAERVRKLTIAAKDLAWAKLSAKITFLCSVHWR